MPKRGGKRAGAGRKPGSPNINTEQLRALCRHHAEEAVGTILKVMKRSRKDANRLAAAEKLLDRGFGKPTQEIDGTVTHNGKVQFTWLPPQPARKPHDPPKS